MALRYRIALAGLALASAGLGALCCTSGSGTGPSERDAGATIDAPAPTTTQIRDAKSDAPKAPKLSADGWQSIYDENSDCLLEVPSTPAAMPPPIRWEPCDEAFADAGVPCRQMAADWTVPDAGTFTSAFEPGSARVRSDGQVLLGMLRSEVQRVVLVVAEADGDVLTAMRNRRDSDLTLPCGMGGGLSVGEDRASWSVSTGYKPDKPYAFAAKQHGVFEVPRIYRSSSFPTGYFAEGLAAKDGLLVAGLGQLDLIDWKTESQTHLVPAQSPGSDEPGMIQLVGSDMVWTAGYKAARLFAAKSGVPAYEVLGGAVPTGRAVPMFSTDGKDLTWIEAEPPTGNSQAIRRLFSVAWGTAPAEVAAKAKLVREFADGTNRADTYMKVGCGYVAEKRARGSPPVAAGLYLNRLSDGREWRLPVGRGGFERALAITCDELFFAAGSSTSLGNIARVRIADLGAGYAPDPDAGL